jgi:hypothetical protein
LEAAAVEEVHLKAVAHASMLKRVARTQTELFLLSSLLTNSQRVQEI